MNYRSLSLKLSDFVYTAIVYLARLLPDDIELGSISLSLVPWASMTMPICNRMLLKKDIVLATNDALKFWKGRPKILKGYRLIFKTKSFHCGSEPIAIGCTHPDETVEVVIKPQASTWEWVLLHEIAHVWLWHYTHNIDAHHHLTASIWDTIPSIEEWHHRNSK
jgi:hypothetical protein